jgi:hypothetical protein
LLVVEPKIITGKTDTAELTAFKQFLFQMQVHSIILVIRSILMSIIIKDNATKYISIESKQHHYQNPNIDYSGNPNLQPTIFDNYEVKLSFYYAFVSYNISSAKNQVINRVTLTNDLVLIVTRIFRRLKFIILVLVCQYPICLPKD